MPVNVLGTWHVLLAGEAAGATRVIHFSSVQALGISEGERVPDYFPVDDDHARRAMRPYGLSKCLAEDLCQGFTARTGIATLSLRPVAVWTPEAYVHIDEQRGLGPRSEWHPFWEYGAFVDVRDVATAVGCALTASLSGHRRALLCASDISASAPSLEIAGRLAPGVPVRDPERYAAAPWGALVDCSAAAAALGWRPRYRWADRGATAST
jgi:UDP-glucose 4-epimerase